MLPEDGRTPVAIERLAREVLDSVPEGQQSDELRCILAAFLGIGEREDFGFDFTFLDNLTPETVFILDMIAADLLELGRTKEAVSAIRRAQFRPVN